MAIDFHWFLPTYGDSRAIVGGGHGQPAAVASGDRDASIGYLSSIVRAAEEFGFIGALTPAGAWCEDAWITTAMLARESERLKFLIAFRPGLVSPTLAAQMSATFDRHAPGRLLLNVVVGGEAHEQRSYGDHLDKEQRYARADEFLTVVRGLWAGETVDLDGEHLKIEQATIPVLPDPAPPLYFGGSSQAALPVAAKHVDVYLTWGEPPDAVAEKVKRVQKVAAEHGRTLRFGIRLHVITRDTADDAWAQAQQMLDALSDEDVAKAQENLKRSESEGQRRMQELNGGSRDGLEVSPNLWAGVGLVRGGAGTALVGSHTEVADRIAEYAEAGIDEFVLSGYPHLEELYWFGEGVLPVLRDRGLTTAGARKSSSGNVPFLPAGGKTP